MKDRPNRKVYPKEDLTIEKWLDLMRNNPEEYVFHESCFPSNEIRLEYLSTIQNRSEKDVKGLIKRFLIPNGWLGADDSALAQLIRAIKEDKEQANRMLQHGYYQRLFKAALGSGESVPWEGITWVLDLLPYRPMLAIDSLSNYLTAHFWMMPDGRINGIYDSQALIRSHYIGTPSSDDQRVVLLQSLPDRDFEHLVREVYVALGYETRLTKKSRDGGLDIEAWTETTGRKEIVAVECKRYSKPVGVSTVRQIAGVVQDGKLNRGVVVTSSNFTKPAREFAANNRIEMVDGIRLSGLLAERFGPHWIEEIDRIIGRSRQREIKDVEFRLIS